MKHYHAGHNTPGYLSEGDVYTTTSLFSAVEYSNEELDSYYDFLYEGCCADFEFDEERVAAYEERYGEYGKEERFSVEKGGEQYIHIEDATSSTDLGYSYWITECDDESCEMDEEDL